MVSVYLDPHQHDALKALVQHTRVPMATYLREAVDDLLLKHEDSAPAIVWDRRPSTEGRPRPVHTAKRLKKAKSKR